MSFTPNIPTTGQSLGTTKQPIQDNFTAINTTLAVNHVAMNASGQGKHKFIQMPSQGNSQAASPGTAANEMAIYTRTNGADDAGAARIYFQFPNTAAGGADYLLTRNITPVLNNNGITFLPGGLILQWGIRVPPNPSDQTVQILFNGAGQVTFPNAIFYASAIGERAGSSPGSTDVFLISGSVLTSGFQIFNNGGHAMTQYRWIALGY